MPIARAADHPTFEGPSSTGGITVTGLVSPSRGVAETTLYRVGFAPGAALLPHRHDHEEVFHLLSGALAAVLDGERIEVAAGDVVIIPPGTVHHAEASSESEVLAAMPAGTRTVPSEGDPVVPPWGR